MRGLRFEVTPLTSTTLTGALSIAATDAVEKMEIAPGIAGGIIAKERTDITRLLLC